MQRKKYKRNEKGSIAVLVAATLIAFYCILIGLYIRATYIRKSQLMADLALKSYYEIEVLNLVRDAKNSGFAWQVKEATYTNGVAKIKLHVEDTYNINCTLIGSNLFNGHFHNGYVSPVDGIIYNEATKPNAVHTDLIPFSAGTYECIGQDSADDVLWMEYDANGNFVRNSATGRTFTTTGSGLVRVLFTSLTKTASERIMIGKQTGFGGLVYSEPSDNIRIWINSMDVTDKVGVTVYKTSSDSQPTQLDYTVEVRDIRMNGDLRIAVAERTISHVVNGVTGYNYDNNLRTNLKITDAE